MKSVILASLLLSFLGGGAALSSASAATVVVDWLAFTAGPDRSHFSLADDRGAAVLSALIGLNSGTQAPTSPSSGSLQSAFWVVPHGFEDSLTGNAAMLTTKVQVAPQSGRVDFRLALAGANLNGMIFAVGQLFSSGGAGTAGVGILASTAGGGAVPVDFLGANAWDDGLRQYTVPLAWSASTGVLAAASGASGNSGFGFFRLPAGGAPVTSLVFSVPEGYASGSGDALEFAFGRALPVPEPGFTGLVAAGLACLAGRRQRRTQ